MAMYAAEVLFVENDFGRRRRPVRST